MKKLLIIFIILFAKSALSEPEFPVPVPEELIRIYLSSILPVDLARESEFEGDLKITGIDDFSFRSGGVLFKITIKGKNLFYFKEEENFNIKIDIKYLLVKFEVDASLDFDRKNRILNVKPRITKKIVQSDSKRVEDHIFQVLALLNNKVYPLKAKKIEPIAEEILGKRLKLKITDIKAEDKILYINTYMNLGTLLK